MKVEVDRAPVPNKPTVSADVKQHSTNPLVTDVTAETTGRRASQYCFTPFVFFARFFFFFFFFFFKYLC